MFQLPRHYHFYCKENRMIILAAEKCLFSQFSCDKSYLNKLEFSVIFVEMRSSEEIVTFSLKFAVR